MLEITDTQARILEAFIDYENIADKITQYCNILILITVFNRRKFGALPNDLMKNIEKLTTMSLKDVLNIIQRRTQETYWKIFQDIGVPRKMIKKELDSLEGIKFLDKRYCRYNKKELEDWMSSFGTKEEVWKEWLIKSNGLSSVGISKKGINKRTFRNNCDFLLDHYLIKVNHKEQHAYSSKKKNNYLDWKYYSLTPFGQLVYWKWNIGHYRPAHLPKNSALALPPPPFSFDRKIGKSKVTLTERILDIKRTAPEINDRTFIEIVKDVLEDIDFIPDVVVVDSDTKKIITTSSDIIVRYTVPFRPNQQLTLQEMYTFTEQKFILNMQSVDPNKPEGENIVDVEQIEYESRLPDNIMDLVEFMIYWRCVTDFALMGRPGETRTVESDTLEITDIMAQKLEEAGDTGIRQQQPLQDLHLPRSMDILTRQLHATGATLSETMGSGMDAIFNMEKVSKKLVKHIQNDPRLLKLFKTYMKKINAKHGQTVNKLFSKFSE